MRFPLLVPVAIGLLISVVGRTTADTITGGRASGGNNVFVSGQLIVAAGLVVGVDVTANTPTVPSGNVISQSPSAGSMVNPGSSVVETISTGPAPGGVQPAITLPSGFSLKWNQDFAAPSYHPFNQPSNVSVAGPPASIWRTLDQQGFGEPGSPFKYDGTEGDPFSTSKGYLNIHANGSGASWSPTYGGILFSGAPDWKAPLGSNLAGFHAGAPCYWEAKLLYPPNGSERWPLWWLMGSSAFADSSGHYGEIDVGEFPNARQGFHIYPGASEVNGSGYIPSGLPDGQWHVWGVLIQKVGTNPVTTTVSIYIDGVLSKELTGLD